MSGALGFNVTDNFMPDEHDSEPRVNYSAFPSAAMVVRGARGPTGPTGFDGANFFGPQGPPGPSGPPGRLPAPMLGGCRGGVPFGARKVGLEGFEKKGIDSRVLRLILLT